MYSTRVHQYQEAWKSWYGVLDSASHISLLLTYSRMQALQAVWLKRLLCGEFSLPPRVEMERAVETEQAAISIGRKLSVCFGGTLVVPQVVVK